MDIDIVKRKLTEVLVYMESYKQIITRGISIRWKMLFMNYQENLIRNSYGMGSKRLYRRMDIQLQA